MRETKKVYTHCSRSFNLRILMRYCVIFVTRCLHLCTVKFGQYSSSLSICVARRSVQSIVSKEENERVEKQWQKWSACSGDVVEAQEEDNCDGKHEYDLGRAKRRTHLLKRLRVVVAQLYPLPHVLRTMRAFDGLHTEIQYPCIAARPQHRAPHWYKRAQTHLPSRAPSRIASLLGDMIDACKNP